MHKQIAIGFLMMLFVGLPRSGQAQLEILLDFLIYDYGVFFGFEGEPGVFDIDFAKYPYEQDYHGLYLPEEDAGFRIRTKVNFHLLNSSDAVNGGYLQVKFSPLSRMTLDVNRLHIYEESGLGEKELYSFTNFSFQYNRVRNHRIHFWWDLGVTKAGNAYDEWGPTAGFGTTIYIKKPVSLYAAARWAYFQEELSTVGFYDLRLQMHLKQFLIYGGIQRVGREVDFTSWIIGTGIYF